MSRFVFSRPDRSVDADGVKQSFDDVSDALAALRDGSASVVVGALPFDTKGPAALVEPDTISFSDGPWQGATTSTLPTARVQSQSPPTREHRDRVARAVRVLHHPGSELRKVVLARSLVLEFGGELDPIALVHKLIANNPMHNGFAVDLTAAGGQYEDQYLVGASPELLVRRTGTRVLCRPFAGTVAREDDPAADAAAGAALLDSSKNLDEHRFVVDAIAEALAPLCTDLVVPDGPTLTSTPEVWHLATPITGTLKDQATTSLDLAVALHPTPAVAGVPTLLALRTIERIESGRALSGRTHQARGFYAGAVGWCDAAGDGEWMVAIRCITIDPDRFSAVATAGGGIVADSDPDDELAETTAKFRTILSALGL